MHRLEAQCLERHACVVGGAVKRGEYIEELLVRGCLQSSSAKHLLQTHNVGRGKEIGVGVVAVVVVIEDMGIDEQSAVAEDTNRLLAPQPSLQGLLEHGSPPGEDHYTPASQQHSTYIG